MRLNAYLARAGVASRRACRRADQGRPGPRERAAGASSTPSSARGDAVEVDGRPVAKQELAYRLLHKPAGTVTTARDPHGRPTVVELVPGEPRVVPVGRLDADTTGALLLTNDGRLAHRLAHPRYEVDKVYEAEVEGDPGARRAAPPRRGRRARRRPHRSGACPPARAGPDRADDPRGPQAPGEADVRGGRPPGATPAPERLRRPGRRRPRAGRVARSHPRGSRCAPPPRRALTTRRT